MTLQGNDIFYYTANILCLFSGLICAVLRWFHMCRPFDKEEAYYYPARKQVTVCYFLILFQFPYLMYLSSFDAWMYVRVFGILFYPVIFTVLLNRYFHYTERIWWRMSLHTVWIISSVLLCVLFLLALRGGDLLAGRAHIVCLLSVMMAVLSMVTMCYTLYRVYVDIRQFQYDKYSNEQDFPLRFARITIVLVLFLMLNMWVLYVSDSRMVKAAVDLLLCFLHTLLILIILYPQRNGKKYALQDSMQVAKGAFHLSDERYGEILGKIRTCIETNRMFLKSNLQLMDIALAVGENRSYVSAVITKEYGSFYAYVNKFRIEYAVQLQKEHPKMKQVELIERCGFGSRTSFLKWQKIYSGKQDVKSV